MYNYKLIRSKRKTLALEINKEAQLIVRAPFFIPEFIIKKFINQKITWINKKQNEIKKMFEDIKLYEKENDLKINKTKAFELISERVNYYSSLHNLQYNKIKITQAKKRWGSCSYTNNLNFSIRLALTPPDVIDYVVVHELCHIKEKNHSMRFWNEVKNIMPDYKEKEKWLKTKGFLLKI